MKKGDIISARRHATEALQLVPNDAETLFLGGLLAASLLGTCVLLTIHGVHAVKLYRFTPAIRNGEPIGAINVTREEARPFSDAQVELLKSFADQAVIAIENGYQVALMAPTEILATQHYLSARRILESAGYRIVMLTGSQEAGR